MLLVSLSIELSNYSITIHQGAVSVLWLGAKEARRIPEVLYWDSISQTVLYGFECLRTHGLLKSREDPPTAAGIILITTASIYSVPTSLLLDAICIEPWFT